MRDWILDYVPELLFVIAVIGLAVCIVLIYVHAQPKTFCNETGCYELRTTCLQHEMVTDLTPIVVPTSNGGTTTTWIINTHPVCIIERIDTVKIK